jgi:hypothetical protein
MPRNYRVREVLNGTMYDAQRLVNEGQVRDAYILLRKKVIEIEKISKVDWCKTDWK